MTEAELAAYKASRSRKMPRRRAEKEFPRMKAAKVIKQQLEDRYEDFDGLCAYCCRDMGNDAELDHIIPTSKGGLDIMENLVYSCGCCNRSKNSRDLVPWLRSRPDYREAVELKLLSVFPHLPLLFLDYYE